MMNFMTLLIEKHPYIPIKYTKQFGMLQNKKNDSSYTCAKCHTPTDTKLIDELNNSDKTVKPSRKFYSNS